MNVQTVETNNKTNTVVVIIKHGFRYINFYTDCYLISPLNVLFHFFSSYQLIQTRQKSYHHQWNVKVVDPGLSLNCHISIYLSCSSLYAKYVFIAKNVDLKRDKIIIWISCIKHCQLSVTPFESGYSHNEALYFV